MPVTYSRCGRTGSQLFTRIRKVFARYSQGIREVFARYSHVSQSIRKVFAKYLQSIRTDQVVEATEGAAGGGERLRYSHVLATYSHLFALFALLEDSTVVQLYL